MSNQAADDDPAMAPCLNGISHSRNLVYNSEPVEVPLKHYAPGNCFRSGGDRLSPLNGVNEGIKFRGFDLRAQLGHAANRVSARSIHISRH